MRRLRNTILNATTVINYRICIPVILLSFFHSAKALIYIIALHLNRLKRKLSLLHMLQDIFKYTNKLIHHIFFNNSCNW